MALLKSLFIFLSISKYGTDDELIKFYEYLLKIEGLRNYTIYSILCDKLTKIFSLLLHSFANFIA